VGKCDSVRRWPHPDHQISAKRCVQEFFPNDLTYLSFQSISFDCRPTISRYDQPDPQIRKGGRAQPSNELGRVKSSPLFPNALNVPALRQPGSARVLQGPTPLRTSTAVSRSAACGLSYADDSELLAPNAFPCVSGTHESGCGACCGDGMLACPSGVSPRNL